MTTTLFTATATAETRADAIQDGYDVLVEEARVRGLDSESISPFEPFASTERGFLWQSFLQNRLGLSVGVAKVYVK